MPCLPLKFFPEYSTDTSVCLMSSIAVDWYPPPPLKFKVNDKPSHTRSLSHLHLMRFAVLQFVPFRDYIDRAGNQVLSMARLAKDVLAEIPEQLLSYMKSQGIEPRPALDGMPTLHMHI